MNKIVLFASGSGSNVENIINYFKNNPQVDVAGIFCNNPSALVIERANRLNVAVELITRESLNDGTVRNQLQSMSPNLIVLAGFLLKFPAEIVRTFPNKIINIHPALLPKYGGKGMYGINVHRSVLANRDAESGISIHYVNEHYDEGDIIFSDSVSVSNCTSPEEIAQKVHELEHRHYPMIIEQLLKTSAN